MAAMGLCEGTHKLGDITVEVRDSRTFVAGTDMLAGRWDWLQSNFTFLVIFVTSMASIAKMDECVRIFHKATGTILSIYNQINQQSSVDLLFRNAIYHWLLTKATVMAALNIILLLSI